MTTGLLALAGLSLLLGAGGGWLQARAPAGPALRLGAGSARLLYFIGLPYLALVTGLLLPRHLGLVGLEHFNLLPAGPPVDVATATTLMLLEWLANGRAAVLGSMAGLALVAALSWHLARHGAAPASLTDGRSPLWQATLYDAVHWAFYRAIFWTVTGDLYLGLVAGAAWSLLEWLLAAWQQTGRPALLPSSSRIILLLITAAIFYASPNLWLLWPAHLAMAAVLERTSRKFLTSGKFLGKVFL